MAEYTWTPQRFSQSAVHVRREATLQTLESGALGGWVGFGAALMVFAGTLFAVGLVVALLALRRRESG